MQIRAADVLCALIALIATGFSSAWGADVVLTIGGGYEPASNQVSLEKNVQYFGRILERSLGEGYRHTILFADGDDPRRDVQYLAPESTSERAVELLALVFDEHEHFRERFRDHQLDETARAATDANLDEWFKTVGSELDDGDRLLIYVTAHGGESRDEQDRHNTRLHLWGDDDVTVRELAARLDELSPEVPVVVVMVQCYSGGFGNLIFAGGRPENGLVGQRRCGFFSTTHDRVAAGCTPEIDEEDYHEYSSSFWAALVGRSRTGETIEQPDYDKDGRTSFSEAHAYVLIQSDTIDVPVKTTDVFLRVYSAVDPRRLLAGRFEEGDDEQSRALRPVEPLTIDAPVDELMAAADLVEQAVLRDLSEQLELDSSDLALAAGRLSGVIDDQMDSLGKQSRRQSRRANWMRRSIERDVLAEWPELKGDWNPAGRRLVREEPEAIVQLIESHARYEEWQEARDEADRLEEQLLELECKEVKCQRLLSQIESIVLANNLPLVADEALIRAYLALRRAENGSLE